MWSSQERQGHHPLIPQMSKPRKDQRSQGICPGLHSQGRAEQGFESGPAWCPTRKLIHLRRAALGAPCPGGGVSVDTREHHVPRETWTEGFRGPLDGRKACGGRSGRDQGPGPCLHPCSPSGFHGLEREAGPGRDPETPCGGQGSCGVAETPPTRRRAHPHLLLFSSRSGAPFSHAWAGFCWRVCALLPGLLLSRRASGHRVFTDAPRWAERISRSSRLLFRLRVCLRDRGRPFPLIALLSSASPPAWGRPGMP